MYVKVEAFNPLGSVKDRMDRPSWQDVETYIANSPIFHIDQMDTPLLVAFGDEGGGRRR